MCSLGPCIKQNPDNKIRMNNIQNSILVEFKGVQYSGEIDIDCLSRLLNNLEGDIISCYLDNFFERFQITSPKTQHKFKESIHAVDRVLSSDKFFSRYETISRSFNIQNLSNTVFVLFYDIRGPLKKLFDDALNSSGKNDLFREAVKEVTNDQSSNPTLKAVLTLTIFSLLVLVPIALILFL